MSHKFYNLGSISGEQLDILQNFTTLDDIQFLTNTGTTDINTIRQSHDISYIQIYTVQDSNRNVVYKSKFLLSK